MTFVAPTTEMPYLSLTDSVAYLYIFNIILSDSLLVYLVADGVNVVLQRQDFVVAVVDLHFQMQYFIKCV